MNSNEFIRKIKRAETPFYRFLKSAVKNIVRPPAPRVPRWLKPPLRAVYEAHFLAIILARSLITSLYRYPVFQARCESIGRNVHIDGLPFVSGHTEISIGDDVWLGGKLFVSSARIFDHPRLIIKDRAEVGWAVTISVSREVVIEEDVRISYDCRISDGDGHPREAVLRAQHAPPHPRDIRPVRICRYAWVGNGTHIMKGVTIGEGAIVGANSVVLSDIPPYSLAMGNPAEVYFRNIGLPSQPKTEGETDSAIQAANTTK